MRGTAARPADMGPADVRLATMRPADMRFGRAVRPAYTIKTPSLAERFQLSKTPETEYHGWHLCVFSTPPLAWGG